MGNTNPGYTTGQIPSASLWNNTYTGKVDATGGILTDGVLNGGTFNGNIGGSPNLAGVWTFLPSTVLAGCTLSSNPMTGTFTGNPAFSGNPTFTGTGTGIAVTNNATFGGSVTSANSIISGTANGTSSLAVTQSQTVTNSLGGAVLNGHASYFGTRASGFLNWYSCAIDIDRVNIPSGAVGFSVAHGFGGGSPNTLTGGRTAFNAGLTMTGDCSTGSGSGAFYVAEGAFARCDYWNGGIPGAEKGSVFGSNPSARMKTLGTIGSRGYRGANAGEFDVGVDFPVIGKQGVTVVEWTDSVSDGYVASYGFGLALQGDGTAPGFEFGYTVGSPFGWWPLRATSTIFGNYGPVGTAGGPTAQAAVGIDFSGITLNRFGYKQTGSAIDGSGNVGGLTVFGQALQTFGGLQAKTAVVNAITAVKGGDFETIPTLVVSASPGGGTLATASVATMTVRRAKSIVAGQGTLYTAGDVLTMSGGTSTTAATFTVAKVNPSGTGAIIDLTVLNPGSYSVLPASPAALTGGTGSGATVTPGWQIATVTVTNAGTLYPEFPPPLLTTSGGTKLAEPMFAVTMTASNADLVLQTAGGGLKSGSGTWSANASVATVLGSIGPVGAGTTVAEWFTVKNAAGTTRYIPAF